MSKTNKISPSDVKRLAEECKQLAESLNFNNPVIGKRESVSKIIPMNESHRYKRLYQYSIMNDDERDNLNESVRETEIYKKLVYDLEAELNNVDEIGVIEEGVVDVLRKYVGKNLLTVAIIAQLLSNSKVTAQQLADAGVEPEKIEVALEQNNQGSVKPGQPLYFNYANVKALAVVDTVDESHFKIFRTFGFTTYNSSSDYKFINVPYTLKTDEKFAKTSENNWSIPFAISYKFYTKNTDNGKTYDNMKDFYVIGTENAEPVTYTVSNYPMKVSTKDGDSLVFLGVQVWEGESRNKTPFFNQDKGVASTQTPYVKSYFLPGTGKSSMSIKGNSVSINLVYGYGLKPKKTVTFPEPLVIKASQLFKYNSIEVDTTATQYREMFQKLLDKLEEFPNHIWEMDMLGGSSQVPTNYPSLTGEKTIEANKQLGEDRAKALGIQLLRDLSAKGVNINNIIKKSAVGKIGDIEYQNDPTNVSRYAPDQYSKITLTPVKKENTQSATPTK